MIRRRLRLALLLLPVLLLAACSSPQLAYRFADDWVLWKIGNYVELEPSQRRRLDLVIDDFFRGIDRINCRSTQISSINKRRAWHLHRLALMNCGKHIQRSSL